MTDWKAIVDQYGRLVWTTAWRLLGSDADASDCFQDVFIEAVKVDRKGVVRDWSALLRHLATARALDMLRVRYRQRGRVDLQAAVECAVARSPRPESEAEAAELAERLRAALPGLPPQQAEVFSLNCLDGLSYREIGQRLQLKTSAVGVLLHRARQRLRELLQDDAARAPAKIDD